MSLFGQALINSSDDRREEESEHINVDVFRFFANALNDKNLKAFAAPKLTQNLNKCRKQDSQVSPIDNYLYISVYA